MNLEHAVLIFNWSSAFVIQKERKEVLLKNTCQKRKKLFFFLLVWTIKNLLQFTLMKLDNFWTSFFLANSFLF